MRDIDIIDIRSNSMRKLDIRSMASSSAQSCSSSPGTTRDQLPLEKPNCRYRLSASRRAGCEMLGAPLPQRPLLQPLDDTVQRWSSCLGPCGTAAFLVAVAHCTNAPRGCFGPLGDPPNKLAIRTLDEAFVGLVLESSRHRRHRWRWRWARR